MSNLKTLSLWLQAAQRWPSKDHSSELLGLSAQLKQNLGKIGSFTFANARATLGRNQYQDQYQIFAPSLEVFCMIPSVTQKKCSFTDPLFPCKTTCQTACPHSSHLPYKSTSQTQIQVQRRQYQVPAITQTLSNSSCASLWEEEDDRWPREQRRKKNLHFRHGKTMLTGEGCQEALRHMQITE